MEKTFLPYLETLKLSVPPSYGYSLLCNLIAPFLAWLEIYHQFADSESDRTSLTSALSTHASQLLYLSNHGHNLYCSGSLPPLPQLQTLMVQTDGWRLFTSLEAPQFFQLAVILREESEHLSAPGNHHPSMFQSQLSHTCRGLCNRHVTSRGKRDTTTPLPQIVRNWILRERASALWFSAVYLARGSHLYKALCLDIVFLTCL